MKTITTIAALLILAAPAAAQNREHLQMAADVRMLQEQAQQLAISLAALNQTLAESLKAITARLDQAADATRRGFADQKVIVENMSGDVRAIRERSDDTNVRITALREELEALRSTVQSLQAPPPPPPVIDPLDPNAPVVAPQPAPPVVVAPPISTAGLSPTRMFDTAKADYAAAQWSLALTGFEQFIRAFPRSENADDAQFYIGETQSAQSRWPDAVAAYNLVIQNYPGANAVPDAYYKRGLAQERLGEVDAARASWETLIKNFRDSTAALLAKQNLDRISRAQPARP